MSDALSWQDRVTKAARHTPQRPYEDNETSCKNLEREYGFDFDEYLCPIRGNDRNYMVGPIGARLVDDLVSYPCGKRHENGGAVAPFA